MSLKISREVRKHPARTTSAQISEVEDSSPWYRWSRKEI